MRQIVAIGGLAQVADDSARRIYRYLLSLPARPRPRVCFIPTASGESRDRVVGFYDAFGTLDCEPSWLSLFNLPSSDLSDFLLNKDIILVGGGNTRSMLAIWREWELDRILRRAGESGIVLAGSSAGANCWFDECTTDSVPGDLTVLPCLGFLEGSFTPHYDVEPKRKPTLHGMLSSGAIKAGYAADNDTALHFVDGRLNRAIRGRGEACAYRVSAAGGEVREEPLDMTRL